MSYQTHPAFIEPVNRNARLWRYMDLPRFLSVLNKRALFFPSVSTLAETDPYEGEPTLAKIRSAQKRGAAEIRKLQLQSAVFKHLNFFNCWHMNDGESDAMWKIYVKNSEGIAIQSTVDRVISSLNTSPDTVYLGEVQYVDHATLAAPTGTIFGFSDYMLKRLAFRHEQEVRLGTYRSDVRMEFFDEFGLLKTPPPGVKPEDVLLSPERKGVYIGVDVPVLIERVVVSPFSPNWFSDLIVSLSQKLGYAFDVVTSEMSRPSPLSSG
jgi:hypothetical protein